MPTVNFMKPDGSAHTISVDEGQLIKPDAIIIWA